MGEKLIPLSNPFGKIPYLELAPRDDTTKHPSREINLRSLHKHEQPQSELPHKMPSAELNPLEKKREKLITEKVHVSGMKMGKKEFDGKFLSGWMDSGRAGVGWILMVLVDMTKEFDLTEEAWNPLVEAIGDVRPERNDKGGTVTNRGYSCSRD